MNTSVQGALPGETREEKTKRNQVFLFFLIEEQRFALPVSCVQTVIPSVEITPVEGASEFLLGVINLHGGILPVINMRKRLDLPAKSLDLSDKIIVAEAPVPGANSPRRAGLLVDRLEGVITPEDKLILPLSEMIRKTASQIEHLINIEGDLIKVYHLAQLLSLDVLKLDLELLDRKV